MSQFTKDSPVYVQAYPINNNNNNNGSTYPSSFPPSAPFAPSQPYAPSSAIANEAGAKEYLSELNWPKPLQEAFLRSVEQIPIRYFICDDSGSMGAMDGTKLMKSGSMIR